MQEASALLGTNSRNPLNAEIFKWTKVIAIFAIALGLIVLFGWSLNIDVFKRLMPGLVSMKAHHAAAIALSGMALYLHTMDPISQARMLARQITATLVLLLGLVALSEYYLGWDAGIERLLFNETAGASSVSRPEPASVISAINLALIGGALLLLESMMWTAAQLAAFLLLALAMLPLGGYMSGNLSLTRFGNTAPISAPAVIGFLMLGAGILVATQNHGFIAQLRKKLLAVGLTTLLSMLVLILGTAFYNFVQKDKASQRVERTYEVILGMESFSGSMHDFLYHNRGFLITGDEYYLTISDKHRDAILDKLARLRHLMSDNPVQHERLMVLDSLVRQRIEQTVLAVRAQREKGHQAVAAIIATGKDDTLTDEIDAKLDELKNAEKNLLQERQQNAEIISSSSLFTLNILMVACSLLLMWIFRTMQYEIAERKLRALELRKFEAAIESTDDAIIIITPEGNIESWNHGAAGLFGYTANEAIGQPMQILVPADWHEACHATLTLILDGKRVDRFETVRRHKDGHLIDVSSTISPVLNDEGKVVGISKIARDITGYKQAEAILRASEERLSAIVETSMDAVVQMDADGIVTVWNKQAERIFGWSSDEIVGRTLHDTIIPPRHREAHLQGMKRFQLTGSGPMLNKRIEIEGLHRDGHEFFAELTVTPIRLRDQYEFSGFLRDITDRKESEETIWKQANFDALTGLPNRHMFHDRMEQAIKKASRADLHLALMFIDLDNFKVINDTLGHNIGDQLLVEASRRIGDCVSETDIVARMGGDEFAVLLTEIDAVDSIDRGARNIIQKLASPFSLKDEVVYVSASIGITMYPNDADTISVLFKNADQAMYVAKSQGRNCHSYFTPALQDAAQAKLRLINDLRGAMANNQLVVYFQPIVELASGKINKAEALVRWRHPEHGMIGPAQFIPLAEETGLILEIGDWVFRESMRCNKRWRTLYNPEFQVSVNKSPIQFYKDGEEQAAWLAHLLEIGMPGQALVIEITEGLLLDSNASINGALLTLHKSKIQVSIDDFGTGYSSLSYLKTFDIDYLKIDQSFVRDLINDPNDQALCEAIIVMAHKLGIKVIAEGVETTKQRDMLAAAGCDYAQGYLYSEPVPTEEFEELLKQA